KVLRDDLEYRREVAEKIKKVGAGFRLSQPETVAKEPTKTEAAQLPPSNTPWHKHRELAVGIVLACMTMVGGILLWLVAPTHSLIVLLGLVAMFFLLVFSAGLTAHYFGRLRLGVVAGTLISALLIGGLGWR